VRRLAVILSLFAVLGMTFATEASATPYTRGGYHGGQRTPTNYGIFVVARFDTIADRQQLLSVDIYSGNGLRIRSADVSVRGLTGRFAGKLIVPVWKPRPPNPVLRMHGDYQSGVFWVGQYREGLRVHVSARTNDNALRTVTIDSRLA
jgi:hypothetical protein